jgi:hypothetical protein
MMKKKFLVIAAIAVLGAVVPVDSANASCVAEIYDVTPDSQSPSSLVAWFRGRCSGRQFQAQHHQLGLRREI